MARNVRVGVLASSLLVSVSDVRVEPDLIVALLAVIARPYWGGTSGVNSYSVGSLRSRQIPIIGVRRICPPRHALLRCPPLCYGPIFRVVGSITKVAC